MNKYLDTFRNLKNKHHTHCVFNNDNDSIGNNLRIDFHDNGDLCGTFFCNEHFQGYDGMMHGGMVAAIADAAMAQCLMGHGIIGYTGKMNIRYLKPVRINRDLSIHCKIIERYRELYKVRADITQCQSSKPYVMVDAGFFEVKK